MYYPDFIRVYGDNLKQRVQEANPDLQLVSRFSRFSPDDGVHTATYVLREGKGLLSKFFGRKLTKIDMDNHPTDSGKITVYSKSLRELTEKIVGDLNKESGRRFKVMYA